MMDDSGPDPAFVASDQAAPRLAPDGLQSGVVFDPRLIADAVAQVDVEKLAPIIRKAADEFYCTVLETAQDYLRDNLDWNLKSHVAMLERENQRMRTELYEVDRIVGPPWCTSEERVKRLREMDRDAADLIALRYAVQFEPHKAKALAAGSRRAKTPQAAECEASQSGPQGQRPKTGGGQ